MVAGVIWCRCSASDFEFCFNLNGEIKFIRGLKPGWPHPAEHFKRTAGNDWIYYTVGDKSGDDGIISWMGEYYLPCLPYSSNPVWEIKYFSNPTVMSALAEWSQLFANLYMADSKGLYPHAKGLIKRILANDEQILYERSQQLNKIIGGKVSVLPPDTRQKRTSATILQNKGGILWINLDSIVLL